MTRPFMLGSGGALQPGCAITSCNSDADGLAALIRDELPLRHAYCRLINGFALAARATERCAGSNSVSPATGSGFGTRRCRPFLGPCGADALRRLARRGRRINTRRPAVFAD